VTRATPGSGEVNIAYQVLGDRPIDLILAPGFIYNVELACANDAPSKLGDEAFRRRRSTAQRGRSGARAIQDAVEEIRAGLHTGECELLDRKVTGDRGSDRRSRSRSGGAGEVLVSQTVKDLVARSGIEFADRGVAELKGVGAWHLYSVADA